MMRETRLTGTTAADGSLVVRSEAAVLGLLYAVQWLDGDFADGVDATITVDLAGVSTTLLTLTNANVDAVYYPRHVPHTEAGAVLTATSGGDRVLPLVAGQVVLTVAQGGDAKTGGCLLFWME